MGMAASQARLLCITARIHDVEFQAQSIQNAKVQLATKEDDAYREYNAALDAATLTIRTMGDDGVKANVPATFNNLCSRNRLQSATDENYAIFNKKGMLIVEDEIENAYSDFKALGLNDPYLFALYMANDEGKPFNNIGNLDKNNKENYIIAQQAAEKACFENLSDIDKSTRLKNYHEDLRSLTGCDDIYARGNVSVDQIQNYDNLLALYKKELYRNHSADIYSRLQNQENNSEEFEYNQGYAEEFAKNVGDELFNYYVNIFKQIQAAGGCVSIEDYNGKHGDAANNSEWLQAMVESGQFTIQIIEEDKNTGDVEFNATAISSDTCLAYTPTAQIDNRAVAKAEAKYEHTLKQINKKDKMYDLDLSKLEAERSALTTEYDSVKKVIEDNIERTFGIFS